MALACPELIAVMNFILNPLRCQNCGAWLSGRKDKKFCDDACRGRKYRKLNPPVPAMRAVEKVLYKNRLLLKFLQSNPPEHGQSDAIFRWLRRKGFDFNFHTHVEMLADGRLAIMCFDEGYILDEIGVQLFQSKNSSLSLLDR